MFLFYCLCTIPILDSNASKYESPVPSRFENLFFGIAILTRVRLVLCASDSVSSSEPGTMTEDTLPCNVAFSDELGLLLPCLLGKELLSL